MNAAAAQDAQPLVGIIMGSQSDWATLENTANMLKQLGVPFEAEVVSAHRTPDRLFEYAETARDRGIQVIIAGAGGAGPADHRVHRVRVDPAGDRGRHGLPHRLRQTRQ